MGSGEAPLGVWHIHARGRFFCFVRYASFGGGGGVKGRNLGERHLSL